MGRYGRRRDYDDDSQASCHSELPTHRRHAGARSGPIRTAKKLRRTTRKYGPYITVILAIGTVMTTVRYPNAVSKLRAARLQQGSYVDSSFFSSPQVPTLGDRMYQTSSSFPTMAHINATGADRGNRNGMRTGAPPALGGSRTWEFAGSAAETEPLKKASKHFAGIKKYRGNYMHAPQLPSVVVPSKPEVMGSAGKERSKKMRKVTDVDILDAEEGGSEPQIDVEGRRETLSESDLAALQAKQEEPLTTGPEEFQGYETSSGGEGDVRSTDSQSTAKVDHQSDAHDSWTGRETEVDTGLSADDMRQKRTLVNDPLWNRVI